MSQGVISPHYYSVYEKCLLAAALKLKCFALLNFITSEMRIKENKVFAVGVCAYSMCFFAVTHGNVCSEASDEGGSDGVGDGGVGTLGLLSRCGDDVKSDEGVETGGCSLHHLEEASEMMAHIKNLSRWGLSLPADLASQLGIGNISILYCCGKKKLKFWKSCCDMVQVLSFP